MGFTKAQEQAMSVRGRTVLVSAAAGSGKTYTLTSRIIQSVIGDGESGADLSRILVVTFTRAAAGELRDRISKALSEAIAAHPGNQRLQKQLLLLGSCDICTIDSFLSDPIKANFEKLGLPASLRLSDEAELHPLREQVMSSVIERMYEKYGLCTDLSLPAVGEKNSLSELLSVLTPARDTSSLFDVLYGLYKKLITSPEGVEQLDSMQRRLLEDSEKDFFETSEGKVVSKRLSLVAEHCAVMLELCCKEIREDAFLRERYLPTFESEKEVCLNLAHTAKTSYGRAQSAFFSYPPGKIPSVKSDENTELSEKMKKTRADKINKAIRDARERYLACTPEEISSQFRETAKYCGILYEILSKFDKDYASEKLSRGVCEFSDMPRFMLRLLTKEDGTPSRTAEQLADSYDEIYIDEYQDVNEIQDRIFELIGKNHRFMVGDIKQSIYGFREAEPSIFSDYRKKMPIYDGSDSTLDSGTTIFMSNNFRCDENVIRFTNEVCSRIFSTCKESIGYTDGDDLVFSKSKISEDYISPKVQLNIIHEPNSDEDRDEVGDAEEKIIDNGAIPDEAIVIANEISKLLTRERRADGKAIRPCDVAVLVRARSAITAVTSALERLNIPYTTPSGSKIFEGAEMKALISLLKIIDNPRDDVSLCSLLTSDASGISLMSLEETITVRRHSDAKSTLYDAVKQYAEGGGELTTPLCMRCGELVHELERLRILSCRLPADKLLRVVAASELFASLTEGAAYTYLYDSACRYVRRGWNGLSEFLGYFERLSQKSDSSAEPAKASDDTVTVMTVHQSKGLEFNTCFLYGFGKQFNLADSKEPLVFDRGLSVTVKLPQSDGGETFRTGRKTTVLREAVALKINSRQIEEEMRILYVALTRARERLYISASISSDYLEYLEKIRLGGSDDYFIRNSKSYLPWIISALDSLGEQEYGKFCKLTLHEKGKLSLDPPIWSDTSQVTETNADDREAQYARLLLKPRKVSEKEAMLRTVPAKAAASKVSPTMLDGSLFVPSSSLPSADELKEADGVAVETRTAIEARIELMRSKKTSFDELLLQNKKPTAAERGSAVHLFLQYCDFSRVEKYGYEKEIERLLEGAFISKRTADIISRAQLAKFFSGGLFELIRKAEQVEREFRFGIFEPAKKFTSDPELAELVEGKKIYVQGSIDLLLRNSDGSIYICDYKTDRISDEEYRDRALLAEHMKQKHANQLASYRRAIARIYGKEPDKTFIYSLPIGEMIEIK